MNELLQFVTLLILIPEYKLDSVCQTLYLINSSDDYFLKTHSASVLNFLLVLILIIFISSQSQQGTLDKISVREFELLDKDGKQRVSIKIEDEGGVVFRLRDLTGTIRLKMDASEEGSGLVLLDSNTDPGIQALAKKGGSSLSIMGKDGKKREY